MYKRKKEELMLERLIDPVNMPEEKDFDRALRPKSLDDFVGQDHLKEILDISIYIQIFIIKNALKFITKNKSL